MAAPKLRRWVDLLAALLRRHYAVPLEDLIDEVPAYGRTKSRSALRRMFERDKDELRAFGVPIETRDVGDGALGYQLRREDFYLPYLALQSDGQRSRPRQIDRHGYRSLRELVFEPDELAAIAEASAYAMTLGIAQLEADMRSATRKLGCDLPLEAFTSPDDRPEIITEVDPDEEPTFNRLNEALRSKKRVTVMYQSLSSATTASRTLAPWGLFFQGHHWYLAAVDDDGSLKNFRLRRIRSIEVNPDRPGTPDYVIDPGFRLAQHAQSKQAWELGDDDLIEIEVEILDASIAAVQVAQLGEPVEGASNHRRFRVRRPEPFLRWLMGAGGAARPVTPPQVVEAFHRAVHDALALYEDTTK